MARTKAEYQAEGMSDASTRPSNKKSHLYNADSWQGKAYKSGYDAVAHPTASHKVTTPTEADGCIMCAAGVPLRGAGTPGAVDNAAFVSKAPKAPTGVKLGAGRILDEHGNTLGTIESLYVAPVDSPAALRRHARIAAMCRGYLKAMAWSSGGETHPQTGEDLEHLEDFEVSEAATLKANDICEAFYDANMTDLGAYVATATHFTGTGHHDRQLIAYEFAGHDFWLTSAGHGVGFWDRGLGRLGERLTAASKAFQGHDAYLGDDLEIHLS
jgi:hypothetical protein